MFNCPRVNLNWNCHARVGSSVDKLNDILVRSFVKPVIYNTFVIYHFIIEETSAVRKKTCVFECYLNRRGENQVEVILWGFLGLFENLDDGRRGVFQYMRDFNCVWFNPEVVEFTIKRLLELDCVEIKFSSPSYQLLDNKMRRWMIIMGINRSVTDRTVSCAVPHPEWIDLIYYIFENFCNEVPTGTYLNLNMYLQYSTDLQRRIFILNTMTSYGKKYIIPSQLYHLNGCHYGFKKQLEVTEADLDDEAGDWISSSDDEWIDIEDRLWSDSKSKSSRAKARRR